MVSFCFFFSSFYLCIDYIFILAHREAVSNAHKQNGICMSKATHGGRVTSALMARANGASITETKALGGWNDGGSYRACYDCQPPLEGLLAAAHFFAKRPESYYLPRASIGELSYLFYSCLLT